MRKLSNAQLRKLKTLFYDFMKGNIKIQEIDKKLEKAIEKLLKVMRTVAG
jgi:hypothetical protein